MPCFNDTDVDSLCGSSNDLFCWKSDCNFHNHHIELIILDFRNSNSAMEQNSKPELIKENMKTFQNAHHPLFQYPRGDPS